MIENPESFHARYGLAEPDVEVRRIMIDRGAPERLIQDGGTRQVAEDETGVLWRLDLAEDETLVCVEVTDATHGPNTAFRSYVLRVPPDVRSAREAVV